MGLTLIAILTAALLLPGIVAARAFYAASETKEVEPSPPTLSSVAGIALVGLFSVGVHLLYASAIHLIAKLPAIIPLPIADPYRLFTADGGGLGGRYAALSLFAGLAWLCLLAQLAGRIVGTLVMACGDRSIFYGPLADIVAAGDGDARFIVAYVLTKVRHEGRIVGYQGMVASLIRGEDRLPTKILLRDANLFYLNVDGDAPIRTEHSRLIDWITIAEGDWENVAFRVFEVVDDQDAVVDGTSIGQVTA